MHSNDTPPSGKFDPTAEADDALAAAVERAELGWTVEEVEAEMVEAGFDFAYAADIVDEAWTVVL
jgi:hypothetical protein